MKFLKKNKNGAKGATNLKSYETKREKAKRESLLSLIVLSLLGFTIVGIAAYIGLEYGTLEKNKYTVLYSILKLFQILSISMIVTLSYFILQYKMYDITKFRDLIKFIAFYASFFFFGLLFFVVVDAILKGFLSADKKIQDILWVEIITSATISLIGSFVLVSCDILYRVYKRESFDAGVPNIFKKNKKLIVLSEIEKKFLFQSALFLDIFSVDDSLPKKESEKKTFNSLENLINDRIRLFKDVLKDSNKKLDAEMVEDFNQRIEVWLAIRHAIKKEANPNNALQKVGQQLKRDIDAINKLQKENAARKINKPVF